MILFTIKNLAVNLQTIALIIGNTYIKFYGSKTDLIA